MTLPKTAYFSMEIAIDASLHTYAGGLGFLAGSHMLSAGQLNFPMVGVTVLWTNGYGEQTIGQDGNIALTYQDRQYDCLVDTGIEVEVKIFGEPVKVRAKKLEKCTFGSVPIYYLTTDFDSNKPEHRKLTKILYDGDERTRVSQEVILGRAGLKVLEAAHENIDVFHINEGHALPALFALLEKFGGNLSEVRKRAVFTTHTPVASGNETHPVELLAEAGFFGNMCQDEAASLGGTNFSLTVAALRMCRKANAVSQLHGHVTEGMWEWVEHRCPIVPITNSVNLHYWQDERINSYKTDEELLSVKKTMKRELFKQVKQQAGKTYDEDVLTIVWARRFTPYKRAMLLFHDYDRMAKLLKDKKVQLIYAGKFHPLDTGGQAMFNQALAYAEEFDNVSVLLNYDLALSGLLKRGADVWLNTPRRPLEASGTSGMSANMNGAIHCSTFDGWAVEGTFDGINGFIINEHVDLSNLSHEDQDNLDHEAMMDLIENRIIPMYYNDKSQWADVMRNAINTAEAYFTSERMVIEYYNQLYKPISL
ncbi:MAG: alpha-glucan family phosphorylase [Cyanobacteria bacterium HKST-UBA06]|nr:alpha-glucan family phosphorylase [Cyanobacteria bacterium HKST-UBA05]MCA9798413.1 alpha-glucan family phosphorylase [Cyanobacteria bacterium HKST-UBA04]MCA9808198.1 alpha-glucan family phosphorylase [Cyanobacteria bacterium HKST-UBA06]MCA9841399.1 alpha-glucan family phosphorylase [Cyanobacteria bacterium HKST-UBA03]